MKIEANAKAVGSTDSLASNLSKEAQQYQSVLDFEKDYKNNPRNVFVYAPERVNTPLIGANPAVLGDGLYVPTGPDLFQVSQSLTSLQSRRLSALAGFTLQITCGFQIKNGFFVDTSTTDIVTPINILFGIVPYSTFDGKYGSNILGANNLFYPIFQANLGNLTWDKANREFYFTYYTNTFNLLDTITERPPGLLYRNFTDNPDKLTVGDLELITNDEVMLLVGLTFEAQANLNDTDFIQNQDTVSGYPGVSFRVSYAFQYYSLLANF